MGRREGATAATRKRHAVETVKSPAGRTQVLAIIRQTVQAGPRRTEEELIANLENAEKAGVTWAPYVVLDELKHWPDWLARSNWTQPKALEELALHARPMDEDAMVVLDRPDRVDFTWRGSRFNIVQQQRSICDLLFAQLTVDVEWREAMDVTLASPLNAPVKTWRVFTIETLRQGEWMGRLAELGSLIRIEQQNRRQRTS